MVKHSQQVVNLLTAFLFLPSLLSIPLFAGTTPFLIINRTSDLSTTDAVQSVILTALNDTANSLENTVNSGFLAESLRQDFANNIARANASNTSSLVWDRASNQGKFVFGTGIQGGLYSGTGVKSTTANNSLPDLGIGAQANIHFGLKGTAFKVKKIWFLKPERTTFYLSGLAFSQKQSGLEVALFNLGLNVHYKLVTPKGPRYLAQWGGIDVGTGLNYATNSISYTAKLSQTSNTAVSGQTATITTNMDYTLGAKSSNFLMPIEVSSNVTLLYLLSFYFGGAVDINLGSSQLTGTASGPITASYSAPVAGIGNLFSGTGTLNLDDGVTGKPSSFITRGFLGLQLNLYTLKIAADYSILGNGTQGVALTIRMAV